MTTSKIYTLWDLLTNGVDIFEDKIPFGIEIPMIQRDYAQGRDTEKPTQIRGNFLRDIHAQLLVFQNGDHVAEPLELDFVYGYLSSGKFVPLDGQQRLTTLYLIHWFIFFKDRKLIDHLDVFSRLSYKSRVSSQEFFEKLNIKGNLERIYSMIAEAEQRDEEWSLIELIQDQSWFQKRWTYDPTVQSVLRMFIDIDKKFHNISSDTLLLHRPLGFYLMDIPDNGMGDSLYIKMNARGKGLTDFENLKALLEGKIHAVDMGLHERFSQGIDKGWLDAVWLFAAPISSNEKKSKAAGAYLLGLITSVTELLFYKSSEKEKVFNFGEDTLLAVYSNRENIAFLVDAMEQICSLQLDGYHDYFASIYSKDVLDERVRYNGKLNVITEVLNTEQIENHDKLMLFAWLIYVNKTAHIGVTRNMRDYLRICRNYINNINQKSRKDFSLTSAIRTDDFNDILGVFSALFDAEDVYGALSSSKLAERKYIQYELRKAERFAFDGRLKPLIQKLEDNNVFRGLIFNIELEKFDSDKLSLIVEDFFSLLAMGDHQEIIRLFISLGYEGTMIANGTNIGDMLFWGGKERWYRVMASPDGEIKPVLSQLFEVFVNRDRSLAMDVFVKEYWQSTQMAIEHGSLKWYLLEYPKMLSKPLYTIKDRAWKVPTVELFDGSFLNGYHCNPFVLELRDRSDIKGLLKYNECYSQYTDHAWLQLKSGVGISQANDSWVLHGAQGRAGFEEIVSRFDLEDISEGRFRFRCVNLVEDVILFVQACAKLGEVERIEVLMEK